jgi:hypothetical protein
MPNELIHTWFPAYRTAILETDFTQISCGVRKALEAICDRLRGPAPIDEEEKQAIADAQRGLAKLRGESVDEWNSEAGNGTNTGV